MAHTTRSRWAPGADEYSPAKEAAAILRGLRTDDPTVIAAWQYEVNYLRVTEARDGNQPAIMPSGTKVYWSPQAEQHARFYVAAYAMARSLIDGEPGAGERWNSADWDEIFDGLAA